MKKLISLGMVLAATILFSNTLAFASNKDKKVEFTRDVIVNGTEVKKGKYQVKFDDKTNEMTVWHGDKLIAKANAHIGSRKTKAISTEILVVKQNNNSVLKGIILEGDEETILVNTETVNVSPQQ
jgi:ethanolamine utilization cobalamin adenosyltransferase